MLRTDEFLNAGENESALQMLLELREAYNGTDHSLIRQKIEALDQATQKLAQGIMNRTIADALKDQSLDQLAEEADQTTHKTLQEAD